MAGGASVRRRAIVAAIHKSSQSKRQRRIEAGKEVLAVLSKVISLLGIKRGIRELQYRYATHVR